MSEKKSNKFLKVFKFIFSNKIPRTIFCVFLVLLIVGIGVFIWQANTRSVDNKYIIAVLEKSSELTTAKLDYTGITKYEDDGVNIISKSDFYMIYEATARVGIDVKEVEVDVDNLRKTVWLKVPSARILDVKINTDKIEYVGTSFSFFNTNQKEDANKAVALAEAKAKEEINKMGVLQMADDQAETLLKGLIQDTIPNSYQIKIEK